MPSPMPMNLRSLLVAICAGSVLFLAGCASNTPRGEAASIIVQPLSQTVPIGETADFSVTATGTAPLSYQWSKNGVEIAGATNASYTTPTIALADSGSTFQVTVSDASGTVTSNAVTLTAGARSPKAGDLRYLLWQQVTVPWNNGGEPGNLGATEESVSNALGTPLEIGSTYITSGLCEWHFSVLFLPPPMTGLSMYYQFDNTNDMPYTSYLQSVATSNAVITSMDLEPACNAIGVSWVQTAQTGGFDYRLEAVPASQIQDAVAADGASSRIVTAVTFDEASGDAILISYGWQGDTTTAYEAKTVVAMPSDVKNQAAILAGEGYFISAFGGNDTDGYMLIGMRVYGDSLPRPIAFGSGSVSGEDTYAPFTRVVWLAESDYGYTIFEQ
jgi:hypothetical protein